MDQVFGIVAGPAIRASATSVSSFLVGGARPFDFTLIGFSSFDTRANDSRSIGALISRRPIMDWRLFMLACNTLLLDLVDFLGAFLDILRAFGTQ